MFLEGALNLQCAPGSQSQYRDIEFIHRSTARVLESRDIVILTHARCTSRRPYIDLVVRRTPIPDGVDLACGDDRGLTKMSVSRWSQCSLHGSLSCAIAGVTTPDIDSSRYRLTRFVGDVDPCIACRR